MIPAIEPCICEDLCCYLVVHLCCVIGKLFLIGLFVNVPQLRLREYILDNRNKAPISPEDVLNILPVVKHITTTTTDATRLFKAAQNSLQKGIQGPVCSNRVMCEQTLTPDLFSL